MEKIRTATLNEITPATQLRPFKSLRDVELEQIILVLNAEPNLEQAAAYLGISKVTLWRKRRDYGIILDKNSV